MPACIELTDLQIGPSPRVQDHLRVSVAARYGGLLNASERPWVELPRRLAGAGIERGDPWLLFFLPLAVSLGRPLQIGLPVDPDLLENAAELMKVWARWYPELTPVPLEVERTAACDPPAADRTACLFSGGVDSFYTLFHAEDGGAVEIQDLLFIDGYDISLANPAAYQRAFDRLAPVAGALGKQLIPLATNLRSTRFREAGWVDLAHGPMLAGSALMLAPRHRQILISATLPFDQLRPFGSHVEIDPLFSTSQTAFRHYGHEVKRHDKLEYLLACPQALDNLRVCYESARGDNCGRCLKCIVVMTPLEVMGALAGSRAFPGGPLDLGRLRRTYLSQGFNTFRNNQAFALARGREDIAAAIEAAFDRTARLDRWLGLGLVRRARDALGRRPALRRLTGGLRPLLWWLGQRLNRLVP